MGLHVFLESVHGKSLLPFIPRFLKCEILPEESNHVTHERKLYLFCLQICAEDLTPVLSRIVLGPLRTLIAADVRAIAVSISCKTRRLFDED